jgi:hypothetical protein
MLNNNLKKSSLAIMITLISTMTIATQTIDVWKSPTCGCCVKWIQHLEKNDFKVIAHDTASSAKLSLIKTKLGIHPKLRSCHTAIIDGMIVEGHVPAADIKQALEQKNIKILSVPKMPLGSPGMEAPGREQPYATIAITKEQKAIIFKKH